MPEPESDQIWVDNSKRGNGRELLICFVNWEDRKVHVVNMLTSVSSTLDIKRFDNKSMVLKEQ